MTQFLTVKGALLEVETFKAESGRAADTALVLLHEGLGCIALWKDFPQRLADKTGLDVVAYSRIGYGNSSPVETPRPLNYMQIEGEDWVPEVLDLLPYKRFILVGHSDGGSIALVHSGFNPGERLLGTVTLAAHVHNEPLCVASIEKAKEAYESGNLREGLARHHGDNVDCAFWGWNQAWLHPDFLDFNIEEYLPRISVPVLAIQGEQDEYGSKKQVDTIVALAGGPSKGLMIPNCRHSIHRDAADTLLDAINEFSNALIIQ